MEILKEAFFDTGKLVPLLAAIYFIVAFMEYRYGGRMRHYLAHLRYWGPAAGAVFGCLPQCGFSVIASALYVKRLISVGTLLAVFISTSDEAVPILLSMPGRLGAVAQLISLKVAIAIAVGYLTDSVIRRTGGPGIRSGGSGPTCSEAGEEHAGCCDHGLDCKPSIVKALVLHPLWHTVKITVFLFTLMLAIAVILEGVGSERIGRVLLSGSALQPVAASFIGLIPNCFASVLLADLYARGAISFGSMFAGLCSGAGLGLLVLVRENEDRADTVRVIGLLLAVSIVAGIVIQWIGGMVR
jgi:hypothetical protein